MTPTTEEARDLLELADRDRHALRVLAADGDVHSSIPLFPAQQYVEKGFKAVLVSHGAVFRRTHDLLELAGLLAFHGLALPVGVELLGRLNPYAVTSRYQVDDADSLTVHEGTEIVAAVESWRSQTLV